MQIESLPVYQINKRDIHPGIPLIYFALRARMGLEDQNAARTSAAGEGLTEPLLTICRRQVAASPFRCIFKHAYEYYSVKYALLWK